jgi:hypothetical protein
VTSGPEEPVLPDTTSDESDLGWGDDPGGTSSGSGQGDPDDLERFLRDVPPHHGD